MSHFGKVFTVVKSENFDNFLKAVGLPEDKVQAMLAEKSTIKTVKNGDSYTFTVGNSQGSKDVTFKSGVEFENTMGPDNYPVKATITVDNNKFTHTIKSDKGDATFKGEFNGDELVMTFTSSKFDGVAKRYYKA